MTSLVQTFPNIIDQIKYNISWLVFDIGYCVAFVTTLIVHELVNGGSRWICEMSNYPDITCFSYILYLAAPYSYSSRILRTKTNTKTLHHTPQPPPPPPQIKK